jgi:hypothetical protein
MQKASDELNLIHSAMPRFSNTHIPGLIPNQNSMEDVSLLEEGIQKEVTVCGVPAL